MNNQILLKKQSFRREYKLVAVEIQHSRTGGQTRMSITKFDKEKIEETNKKVRQIQTRRSDTETRTNLGRERSTSPVAAAGRAPTNQWRR
jgi:hypothetical protein